MSFSDAFEDDVLDLIFLATAMANIADNAATSPITNIQYSLHTGDPGEAGNQTTSESAYTSYARTAVARTGGGHTSAAGTVNPVAAITFPAGTGGSGTVTHFGAGRDASAAGLLFGSGTVSPNIVTGDGVTPELSTATAITLG